MHTTSCRWKCGIIICHTPGAQEGRGISFIRVCALSDRRLPIPIGNGIRGNFLTGSRRESTVLCLAKIFIYQTVTRGTCM